MFQRLVLDQGFYPEGIWTAPTDEALKGDIELSMAAGFNGARLHQKVFEPRFLYWADKLGYLCWGEYPSYGPDYNRTEVDVPFIREWGELVQRDFNHPSIIGWCPFNETPDVAARVIDPVVRLTRLIDPDRPVIDTSGWVHTFTDPELLDAHDYDQNPETFKARWIDYFNNTLPKRYQNSGPRNIPFFISEFGGIGWFQNADNSWGYGNNPKTEDEFFTRLKGLVDGLLENPRLFGFCYTQLTDIEQEKNGVFYYDRRPKFDLKKFNAVFSAPAAYEKNPPLKIEVKEYQWDLLLGTEIDTTATPWRYRFDAPPEGWEKPGFDDSGWKSGKAAFGKKGGWNDHIKTPWSDKDIWLRNEFEYDGSAFKRATLVAHYDNATDVYLNGELLWHGPTWTDRYAAFDITEKLPKLLKAGKNVVAVHCHQDDGGQYIDVGILVGK